MKNDRLFFREWFVVFLVALIAFLLVFSQNSLVSYGGFGKKKGFCTVSDRKKIQITVSGAVEFPGVYDVDSGISIGSILELAKLKSSADKKALYVKKTVFNSCKLQVPEKISKKEKKKKPR